MKLCISSVDASGGVASNPLCFSCLRVDQILFARPGACTRACDETFGRNWPRLAFLKYLGAVSLGNLSKKTHLKLSICLIQYVSCILNLQLRHGFLGVPSHTLASSGSFGVPILIPATSSCPMRRMCIMVMKQKQPRTHDP